jgi:EmrB/QacA subfamily drug resistance transporter
VTSARASSVTPATTESADASEHSIAAQDRHAWVVFSVTGLGILLTGLNASTLDVALPSVVRHFSASATAATWILLSFLLVTTILVVPFGRLADIIGRRRLYLIGLGLLTGASLVAGAAPDVAVLIIARIAQAVGAASIMANVTAILADAFRPSKLSIGLGANVTVAAVGLVAGPAVGGVVADGLDWRWVFWFNVPLGILGMLWAVPTLRELPRQGAREPFDYAGAVLSAIVVGALVTAVALGGTHGWTAWPVVTGAITFIVGFPVLIWTQRRESFPLLDIQLFADRTRAIAFSVTFVIAFARFGIVLILSLYLQAAHGWSAVRTGLIITPTAIGMMIAAPIAARLARTISARFLASAGLAITAASLFYIAAELNPHTGATALVVVLGGVGLGTGLVMTPNTSSIMASVTAGQRGVANALRALMQNVGTVIGTAVSLAIVTRPLAPPDQAAAYAGTLSRLSADMLPAFTAGYHRALLLLGITTAAGAIASLLRNPPPIT